MRRNPRLHLVAALGLTVALAPTTRAQAEEQAGGSAEAAGKDNDNEKRQGKGEKAKEVSQKEGEMPVYGDTMVVTATRTEEKVVTAPVSITVVGPQQLETSPADNYADALRGVPGLNVVQTSARDVNFTSRSASSTLATGILALMDGRSLYQDFFGFVAWDFLPVSLDEVEQIEVLRSPGSAIWGANALTGVINVRTKSPREIQGFAGRVGGGEQGTFDAFARWADASERWAYKVSASYYTQDPWDRDDTLPNGDPLPPGTDFENSGTEQPKIDARVDYDNGKDRWSFSGGGGYTSGLIHTGIGPFDIDNSTGQTYGMAAYTRGSFDANLYLNHLDGDAKNLINGLDFEFKNTTVNLEATDRRAVGEHNLLVFGGNVRTSQFDLSLAPREDHRNEVGFFLEDQISAGEAFKLNLGARADWFDTIGWTLSPRASVVVQPVHDHAIRFAYNRAFRAPSLVNNYLETAVPYVIPLPPPISRDFVTAAAAVGNEDLEEEKVDAFEIGYSANIHERLSVSAAVYRNETENVIDFAPVAYYGPSDPPPGWPLPPAFVPPGRFPKVYSYRNIGKVVDKGLELSANIALASKTELVLSYTYQDEPEVSDNDPAQPLVTNIPPENQFSAAISTTYGNWAGSFSVNYVGEAFWSDVLDARFWGYTDSYTMLNASLAYRFLDGRYTLGIDGTNLTDERIKQHVFGDIIGRKVTGKVGFKF